MFYASFFFSVVDNEQLNFSCEDVLASVKVELRITPFDSTELLATCEIYYLIFFILKESQILDIWCHIEVCHLPEKVYKKFSLQKLICISMVFT